MTSRETNFYAAMIARAGSLETYLKALELARSEATASRFSIRLPLSRQTIEDAIDKVVAGQKAA